ncbi:MAG: hypothetical protein QM733_20510 [Ilumatobacteraceae bacterium]
MRWSRVADPRWATVAAAVGFAGGLALDLAGAPAPVFGPVYAFGMLLGGWMPALDSVRALRERRLDVDLLMVVAALAAVALGQWRDGALLIVIFATTGALEEAATARTAADMRTLVVGAPDTAELLIGGGDTITMAPEALTVGDRVLIRPGARVPADGTVVEGEGAVDELSLTGEPLPVRKVPGRTVLAGTTVAEGVIVVDVDRVAADNTLARLAAAVDGGRQERVEQLFCHGRGGEAQAEREHVGVVPAAGAAGRLRVGAQRGAHPGHLVGGDRDAGAGPAADDADVAMAVGDQLTDAPAGVGPRVAVRGDDHLVATLRQQLADVVGHRGHLVGPEPHAHIDAFAHRAWSVDPSGG